MIEFKTRKRRPNHPFDYTVRRIAQIACGLPMVDKPISETEIPYQKENGTWVLDVGNNWFLHFQKEDDDYRYWDIDYRYARNDESQEALAGMAAFIEWSFR